MDVAGVEPALGPLNGHILVGGRTPFAEFEVQRFRGRTNPDRHNITSIQLTTRVASPRVSPWDRANVIFLGAVLTLHPDWVRPA